MNSKIIITVFLNLITQFKKSDRKPVKKIAISNHNLKQSFFLLNQFTDIYCSEIYFKIIDNFWNGGRCVCIHVSTECFSGFEHACPYQSSKFSLFTFTSMAISTFSKIANKGHLIVKYTNLYMILHYIFIPNI